MLAACKSGKIKMLALPATWDPGALRSATDGTMDASNCNSPSNAKSTLRPFKSSTAATTLSTSGEEADPFVEKDKKDTRGSFIPATERALPTLDSAISANCSDVGLGITPQSEKINSPSSPYSFLSVITSIELDTVFKPACVPTTWIAARSTFAVGLAEPATMPSAKPKRTNIAPKNNASPVIVACAFSGVMPFFARNSTNVSTILFNSPNVAGLMISAPSKDTPAAVAAA